MTHEREVAAVAAEEQSASERMVRVETKLDLLITRIDPVITDHESRLRKLEAKVWVASGIALAGGGAIGTVAGHFLGA